MNIGRSIRRTVRPLWVAAVGAALWSNRRELLDAFQRWGRKAGGATKSFTAGDPAGPGAARWVTRLRPQARPGTGGATDATDATGSPAEAYEVGATW